MAELLKPDLCVIGAGPGGLEAATSAAILGAAVVLVERGPMGGQGLAGGLASSALIAAARHARMLRAADAFGVAAPGVAIDFAKVRAHVRGVVAAVAPNVARERLSGFAIRVIEGEARFTGRRVVAVGDSILIRARRFVIATGAAAAPAAIAGLDSVPYVTEDTILHIADIPRHLVVVGAGAHALALAQAFHGFGSAVTVLCAATPLADEDPECTRILLDQIERAGIALRRGVTIARVAPADETIEVMLAGADGEEVITASHLLVAADRRPCVAALGLDAARIKCGTRGIVVDHALRTSNRRVYAIGDVIGVAPSVQAARHHASLVVRKALLRRAVSLNQALIPRVIATEPALAHVGLDEAAARHRGHAIRVLRWPYRENDRAQAERQAESVVRGHFKVVTDHKGRVLGATIVGRDAAELIAPWSLAVSQGLNIRALAGTIVPYPTLAEVGIRAATTYLMPGLTRSWGRRIIGWLRRLG